MHREIETILAGTFHGCLVRGRPILPSACGSVLRYMNWVPPSQTIIPSGGTLSTEYLCNLQKIVRASSSAYLKNFWSCEVRPTFSREAPRKVSTPNPLLTQVSKLRRKVYAFSGMACSEYTKHTNIVMPLSHRCDEDVKLD